MIIVTPAQMKFLEAEADRNGNSYEKLMETAGTRLAEKIKEMLSESVVKNVVFLCGNGNNAGDCFVAARILENSDIKCFVALLCGKPKTDISEKNYNRLGNMEILENTEEIKKLLDSGSISLVVDGVFGTGFHGELPDNISEIFSACKDIRILAVDVPSGGNCMTGVAANGMPAAYKTLTFGYKKVGMTQYPLKSLCGKISVADICIPDCYTEKFEYIINETDSAMMRKVLPRRKPDSHKGDYGRLLTVCGSECMPGACIMALEAAVKSGAGLVQAAVPKTLMPVIASRLPEVMLVPLETDDEGYITADNYEKIINLSGKAAAVLVGCGLGVTEQTKILIKKLVTNIKCPTIIDADGINCIEGCIDIIKQSVSDIIVTPHPAEMGRLCSKTTDMVQSDRLETALELKKEFENLTVVLKGAGTVIAGSDKVFINPNGNPGMAKGGSGDVLAGIIASLKAQGLNSPECASLGVFIHGLAGDIAASALSMQSMTAMDIVKNLPKAFKEIAE
ncbi:MAG: NAD(P)H-hydrate dehydratase [Ruminococcus sp.]|nr:NAD(P)H-hydrate dehydratase [Ruminococcus sp.]